MFKLTNKICISCDSEFTVAGIKLKEYFALFFNIEADLGDNNAVIIIKKDVFEKEHFSLSVSDKKVVISAADLSGALYGISTFIQSIDRITLEAENIEIKDGPYKKMRGVHLYLPARKNIEAYKKILDVISFFKMNTVIIEVSGAMEYERHPEINEKWEWFCNIADNVFPGEGKSRSIQWADIYWKDSIHTEHAGGSYLTKAEVRDIVKYAKSCGLNVIPEIQALSHSYYLTLAHREIAELQDDMFPDSYCPLNDKSYELYFDVAEEIIEVFEPKVVSVGHDEIRVLGQCEKCREKTGHDILAYELNRLHDFYEKHNIQMMMWGEMLQHYVNYKGAAVGEGIDSINEYGFRYTLPATYKAKYDIPKDIITLDWQYSRSHDSEKQFEKDGFTPMFGNFRGSRILNWKERSKSENMLGAEVSTWVTTDEVTFARDGIFFEIMFSADILWNDDYNDEKYESTMEHVINRMYYTRAIMRGETSAIQNGRRISEIIYTGDKENSQTDFDINKATSACKYTKNTVAEFGDKLYGVPIDTVNVLIKKEFQADYLVFAHSAKLDMDFVPSHLFPDDSKLGIGTYAILYEDGDMEFANIIFGKTIGNIDFKIKCGDGMEEDVSFEIDNDAGEKRAGIKAPTFKPQSQWNDSILYETVPVFDGDKALFVYEWKNPHPDKKIIKIKAMNTCKDKKQCALLFGIGAI